METSNTTRPIALVFSMHKVGSSTVMQAFREIGRLPERGYETNLENLQPLSKYEAVVSPVRDPIARNVSYFFELYGEQLKDMTLKNIFKAMMSNQEFTMDHAYPVNWFKKVFEPTFGIDVYKRRFGKKNGWSVLDDRYLLIQVEQMSKKLPSAFYSLFGERPPSIHRAATEDTRPWGEVYSDFLAWVKFPKEMLDAAYDSEYVKHFYLKEQIEMMRAQWEK